jgi:putative FmdB family regulatory protein
MPIFEYVCDGCDTRFEKLVLSATGERQLQCPICGSSAIKKALSVFGTSRGSRSTGAAVSSNCAPSG